MNGATLDARLSLPFESKTYIDGFPLFIFILVVMHLNKWLKWAQLRNGRNGRQS